MEKLIGRKQKILITGSTGLVGSACVALFNAIGWDVVGVDNNQRAKMFGTPTKSPQIDLDIRDPIAVESLFSIHKFDAIIHTAAQPSHDYSTENTIEDFTINTVGTLVLLEATRKLCPNAVFVYISTDKVYGENMIREPLEEGDTRYFHDQPFDETLPLDGACRSFFGCSKLSADLYVQEYGYQFGMKTVCFRCGCITGAKHEGAEMHGFLAYLAKCIKEEKTYKIFGYKGKQVRDQIHALDLASACQKFIKNPKVAAVYNLGGGPERSISILEAIDEIENRTQKVAKTEYVDEPRKGDRQWDVHDVSKFKKDYPDWDYAYSLKVILDELCDVKRV